MTECLHGFARSSTSHVSPTSVAVELFKVLDHGLHKILNSTLYIGPYLRRVENYTLVNNAGIVPVVDDFLGTADDVELFFEVMGLKDGARLELFRNTFLAGSNTFGVSALPDILESATCEDGRRVNCRLSRVVGSLV